jgi:ADP-glucose pyrophosphorylase
MDYLKFVEHHRATNADITIGCLPVDYERASDFGLMKIDEEGRIFVSHQQPRFPIAYSAIHRSALLLVVLEVEQEH